MARIKLLVLLLTICFKNTFTHKPNVCKTFADYYHMKNNKNCWFNPDVDRDFYHTVRLHGYPLETHKVVTEDGYINTIFRIPQVNAKEVIVLEPPFTGTSANYVRSGDFSIAFALYNAGFDVWLPNTRGTFYSPTHVNYTENDYIYWNFSLHEIGFYDYPAHFKYIKNITKRNDVICIGYSMSGSLTLIYSSILAKHASEHVKLFISLGPTVYPRKNLPSSASILAYKSALNKVKLNTVFPTFEIGKMWFRHLCVTNPLKSLCLRVVLNYVGKKSNNLDPTIFPVLFNNMPTRIPLKILTHYMQITLTNRFQQYDYGFDENLKRYNSSIAPLYPLHKILVPQYIIHGDMDAPCSIDNVEKIYRDLPQRAKIYGKYLIKGYNHIDYLYAKDAKQKVVEHIIKFIKDKF